MAETKITTGRRKTSVAQAEVIKGAGKITINQRPLNDYFRGCPRYQDTVMEPLTELKAEKAYDVTVRLSAVVLHPKPVQCATQLQGPLLLWAKKIIKL